MNTFGRSFRITTFGESHGPALGVVIDGCPPGIALSEGDIQPFLDRRRPGRSPHSSPRREEDRVEILSGVFEGRTTGAPIALLFRNSDSRPGDYGSLREVFRPGHADYTWWRKYGIRDHRGGGRSSGRETVARVAAGAVAAKVLEQKGIRIGSRVLEIHGRTSPEEMEAAIADAIQAGDSVGGVVEVTAGGCPPGLGDPVFGKLDAMIGLAMLSIGAVKGVEIGDGFAAARVRGSEQNDQMEREGFLTNHAGGILGGISTGAEIVVRIAVKPTPSIAKEQRTVDNAGEERVISVKGRHDPCIVPRLVPVAEAMLALVLADALMEQEKIGTWVTGG
ncbi:MAG TPA: chorismate synthase [Methanolinea sp.]|jgi:chorismate synthase|nr:MAG: chorismate synthase [Methanoregulaceae archaeon PtaB.Bin009]OPY41119.1 MAG: chorismate synthase [Methanoregulaceae archaeon PtaU1.Bin066]HII76837.1 chorismate synthase [Methanolinea sp.]HNQ29145.1 chorismate synthase [Methanolinea sp.]HNS82843.1 chorismate synthase [Methanolinea sp.]